LEDFLVSYKDHRPALKISTLPVSRVDFLPATGKPWFACPSCGRWSGLYKGAVAAHRAADNVTRCKESGRKVEVDVPAADHRRRRALAVAEAAQRRAVYSNRRAHAEPRVPIPAPLTGRRVPQPAQRSGWTGREAAFANPREPWNTGHRHTADE
jgi:hypothetical protein